MNAIHTFLVAAITATALQVLFLARQEDRRPPRIVAVDFDRIALARARRTGAEMRSHPEALLEDAQRYGERVSRAIEAIAREGGYVVLPSTAVAAGASDITDAVLARLEERTEGDAR